MKKLILSFFFAVGLIATTHAQCVPVNLINAGFSPVADSMPCYVIGQAISGVGSILNFKCYDQISNLPVEYLIFDSITNLPAGMSYSMNKPLGTQYQSSETGCISLSGTPTSGCGQYLLGIYVRLKVQNLPVQAGEQGVFSRVYNAPFFSHILRVKASSDNCPCISYTPIDPTDSVGVTKPGRKACIAGSPECPTTSATGNCNLIYNVNVAGSLSSCIGDTVLLIANAASQYNYQWFNNAQALAGQTNDTLVVTSAGSYQLQADSGSCTVLSSTSNNITFGQAPAVPVLNKYGSITSCTTSNISLHAPGGYSYLWSNGGTNDSIQVRASDEYTVTITGANGCTAASSPYPVNLSFLAPYQICAVTVDSITGYNTIVWEKQSKTGVDSFYVYKKTPNTKYEKIGAVGVNDLSIFSDVNSNPQQENAIYKICARDTCGIAALSGDIHKTIYLTTSQGLGVWNLTWTQYVGFTFPSYNIYRGTSSTSQQLIATVPSGTNSYSDPNPPANERYYQIEAVNPNGCLPTAKTAKYSASKSNMVIAVAAGVENTLQNDKWAVYPNPTSEMVVLAEIANINVEGYSVQVTNSIGQVVINKALMNRETKLNAKEWGNGGMYFFHILDTENRIVAVKKIIVQ